MSEINGKFAFVNIVLEVIQQWTPFGGHQWCHDDREPVECNSFFLIDQLYIEQNKISTKKKKKKISQK